MRYLLDASALVPLLSGLGKRLIVKAAEERLFTTDLAVYEACNSLWKLCTLLNSISPDDAVDAVGALRDLVAREIVGAVEFTELDLARIFRLAVEETLTFYDASYIVAAGNAEAILITEDKKLNEAARKHVRVTTYGDFQDLLDSERGRSLESVQP
jgi:predicted nucleic acid-binding protein